MSNCKYESRVVSIGEYTREFIEGGILVFFGPDAPEELAEFAIIHTHPGLEEDVCPGDELVIGAQRWSVLCVGDLANQNLRALGHFVVKFNGLNEPELPGDISVAEGAAPPVAPGTTIQFVAGSA